MLRCASAHRRGSRTALPGVGRPAGETHEDHPTTTPPAHLLVGVRWRAFFVSEWDPVRSPPADLQTTHPTCCRLSAGQGIQGCPRAERKPTGHARAARWWEPEREAVTLDQCQLTN